MFTGIVEQLGMVLKLEPMGSSMRYTLQAALAPELRIDQSLAHDGVCLTVVAQQADTYAVVAVEETLQRTTLGHWQPGTRVNLERCLRPDGRLDGHFVQGHVDAQGTLLSIDDRQGSWRMRFQHPPEYAALVVQKGSVCINGVSLTVFDLTNDTFSVAIIPYTYAHTNLGLLQPGQAVNLEFDILGKYIQRALQLQQR